MLSRIAESLYWMARHLERADNTARILDINLVHMLESDEGISEEMRWRPLMAILDADQAFRRVYPDSRVTIQRVIHLLTQDRANPGSILNSLEQARENARAVRDRISIPMWETLNAFWLTADQHLTATLPPWRAAEFFSYVHREVACFFGLGQSTMMRGQSYGFTALGSLHERADMSARILDVRYHLLLPEPGLVGSPLDYYQWGALLKSLSGFEPYRRRYQDGIKPTEVVDFVILDADFPRSLAYAVDGMERALARIGQPVAGGVGDRLSALRRHLAGVSAPQIIERGLHEYLNEFLARSSAFGDALQQDYFDAYAEDAQ